MAFADIHNLKKLTKLIKASLILKIVNIIKGNDYGGLLDLVLTKYMN